MNNLVISKDFILSLKIKYCTSQTEYCRQPKGHISPITVTISKEKLLWFQQF